MFFSRIVENIEKFSSSIGQPHPPLGTGTTTVCAFDVQTSELANVTAGISSWVSKPSANSIRRRLRRAFKFAWAQCVGTWLSDAGNKSACCADWLSSLSSITASSAAVGPRTTARKVRSFRLIARPMHCENTSRLQAPRTSFSHPPSHNSPCDLCAFSVPFTWVLLGEDLVFRSRLVKRM